MVYNWLNNANIDKRREFARNKMSLFDVIVKEFSEKMECFNVSPQVLFVVNHHHVIKYP